MLFASYLRPGPLEVPAWGEVLAQAMAPGLRQRRFYFGLYPFRWQPGWQEAFRQLVPGEDPSLQVAPVLERLVFPRCRDALLNWIGRLAQLPHLRYLIPAHYEAPIACDGARLEQLAAALAARPWAPEQDSWATLARLDDTLLKLGLVPRHPQG